MDARAEGIPDDATPWVPDGAELSELRVAAEGCRGCDLWAGATQTVFGEGREAAQMMLIGEQPGDREDLQGAPFVGPAGRVLDTALVEAGVAREDVYVTNAVKHFRHEHRGKKRIHRKPTLRQVGACAPWLRAEIGAVRPSVIVALGATAARAVLGPGGDRDILKRRGRIEPTTLDAPVLISVHPSSIVRIRDRDERRFAAAALAADLRTAAQVATDESSRRRASAGLGDDAAPFGHDPRQ